VPCAEVRPGRDGARATTGISSNGLWSVERARGRRPGEVDSHSTWVWTMQVVSGVLEVCKRGGRPAVGQGLAIMTGVGHHEKRSHALATLPGRRTTLRVMVSQKKVRLVSHP
jgi:hypothetical protein